MVSKLLENKTAVITGCNRGIGKAILEHYSKSGADCIACIRKKDINFENYCGKLSSENKTKIQIVSFDLINENEVMDGVKEILTITKKIDILVNNAGILFNSIFHMTSQKKLKEMFQINFFSHIILTQQISREMTKNKKGSVIFISSTSAERKDVGRFAYSSSKAAISSTVRVIAKEFGAQNVRVNAICPGLTKTDMSDQNTRDDFLVEEMKKISLKRLGKTKEIANVAVFLGSDLSSYITGQNITVDGGV